MSRFLLLAASLAVLALPAAAQAPATPEAGGVPAAVPAPQPEVDTAPEPEGVDEDLRGTWFAGDCARPTALLHLTARTVARVPVRRDVPGRLWRFTALRDGRGATAGWTWGIARGSEAARLLLRGRTGGEVAGGTPGKADGLETLEADPKLRDDEVTTDAPTTLWHRCTGVPAGLALLHGEGVAAMAALEEIEAGCAGGAAACAGAVLRATDVSGDDQLTVAEVARLARGVAWLLALQEGATPATLAGTAAGGALGGLALARLVVDSLDYDGDGRLSAAELTRDRLDFGTARGTAAGSPLRTEGVSAALAAARALLEGFASGLGGADATTERPAP